MLIEEMVFEVVKGKHHPLTTNEIKNMVNNLFELNLKYPEIYNALSKLKTTGKINCSKKFHLDYWLEI